MKKNIWIMNHYATNMYFNEGGRHYWFAQNLIKNGYKPTIFSSNVRHNSHDIIPMDKDLYKRDIKDKIPFVFVKSLAYKDNGRGRVFNMISFYNNLFPVAKAYAKSFEKPDIILASSVHPLTMVAGIKIAKKFNIPCICEVRDLWPESLVAYGSLKANSILAKILYGGEKWIYKRAHRIIMTWEGGAQYIKDRGWDGEIDLSRVKHINNGVDLDAFDEHARKNPQVDFDLEDKEYKNIVYTGSIRKVNNIGLLLDAAKILKEKDKSVRFLIYGAGDEKDKLEDRCAHEGIDNVIFKGLVNKNMIPQILKKAYINIIQNSSTSLDKYGQSQNKLFEYLAAGRPIIQTYKTGYSILDKYKCGISLREQSPEEVSGAILKLTCDKPLRDQMGENARGAALDYDFKLLTHKLIDIIEDI